MYTHAATDKGVRRFIRRVSKDLLPALFELRFADTRAQGPAGDLDAELQYAQRVRKILEEKPPLSVRDLEVDGYDVMRILGIPPGPKVGEVLNYLLAAVIDDPNRNRREILEEMIRNYDKNKKGGNDG
jgi:tRNA nucleotidyltransferase/poly(A) polymerase